MHPNSWVSDCSTEDNIGDSGSETGHTHSLHSTQPASSQNHIEIFLHDSALDSRDLLKTLPMGSMSKALLCFLRMTAAN